MKEKIKNLSNKKIVIISLCTFVILLLLGLTYAIWSRTFSQTGENISTYDCFDISFSENTDGITMENGYPISDEEGLKSEAYEVTITNTCKTAASYNVVLNKLNTSTLDDNHVKVAVNSDIKLLSETETTTSTISNASGARIINTGILGSKETRTIKVRNWMDENTSEEEGANKTFTYKITIEAAAGSKQLNVLILANNKVIITKPNLSKPSISVQTYDNMPTKYKNKYTTDNGLYQDEDDDGLTYYFRGAVENNYVKFGNLKFVDNPTIAQKYYNGDLDECTSELDDWSVYDPKSFCNEKLGNDNNDMLWRVVRINGDNTIRLILDNEIGSTYWTDDFNNIDEVAYYHKERTGKYKDAQNIKQFSDQPFALCDSCYYADSYNFDDNTGLYTLANPVLRTSQECTADNSLCNDKYTLYSKESDTMIYKMKVGAAGQVNMAKPVYDENQESKSNVKTIVDSWYEKNLKEYENKIAISNFCNDTRSSYGASYMHFGKYLSSEQYSFKCPETNEEYGGNLKLKVGLLSRDEVRFAGISSNISNLGGYLSNVPSFWLMTPEQFLIPDSGTLYGVELGEERKMYINTNQYPYQIEPYVRPVINLKSNVKVISGDGTKERPYVIE